MGSNSRRNAKHSMRARLARRFGHRIEVADTDTADPVTSSPATKDLDGLSERLRGMRGTNVTVVQEAGAPAPNRDGMKNLTNAARDARYVDRSNEDEAVSDLRSYRTSK